MVGLLRLLVRSVLMAPLAVLAQLDPVGIVLLVLQGGVVAPLADAAGQGDDFFHASLFGWGKEKSLGFLGLVNSSRRFARSIDRRAKKDYKRPGRRPVIPRRNKTMLGFKRLFAALAVSSVIAWLSSAPALASN